MKTVLITGAVVVLAVEAYLVVLPNRTAALWVSGAIAAALMLWTRATLDDDAAPDAAEAPDDAAHSVRRWRERTAALVGWADSTRGDWDRHLRPMLAREFVLTTRQRQSKDRAAMVATGQMLFGPQLWQWVDPRNVDYAERDAPGPGRAALEEILRRMERL